MSHNSDVLLKVEGLVKKFGGFRALNGVNISVGKNKIVGLPVPTDPAKPL